MPSLRAGSMRDRVQIQSRTDSIDAGGQEQSTWTTIYTCWAEINQYVASNKEDLGVRVNSLQAKVTTRYNAVIIPTMRVLVNNTGDLYIIDQVADPDGIKFVMDLHCTKRTVGDA